MNRFAKELMELVVFTACILLGFYIVLWPFAIDGPSMENSFFNNDRIAISRLYSFFAPFEHEQIVVCNTDYDGKPTLIIKRVVGVPGDNVKIASGKVYVNGKELTESYIKAQYTWGDLETTLGEDEYFIMGDNREVSLDSRIIGAVKRADIVGRVFIRWFPFNRMALY